MFFKRQVITPTVIEVEKPVYIEKVVRETIAIIPHTKRVGIAITKMSDVHSLYLRFSALQHDAEWKVTRCYDIASEQGVGLIYFDIPSDKALDTLRLLISEYELSLKTITV